MSVSNGRMRIVSSVLVGGLVGAGVALLFAPQSGRRTRRDIRNMGQKLGRELRCSFEDLSEKMQDGLERSMDWTRETTRDALGSGKNYLRGLHRLRRAS